MAIPPKPKKIKYEDKLASMHSRSYEEIVHLSEGEIEFESEKYILECRRLEDEFENKTGLGKFDWSILLIGAAVQCIRWYMITNSDYRFKTAASSDKAIENIGRSIGRHIPSLEEIIADHSVPYDAIATTEFYKIHFDGVSTGIAGNNHRFTTLGHDPLAGLIFGTANIATNTLTKNDFPYLSSYYVVDHKIDLPLEFGDVVSMTQEAYQTDKVAIGAAFMKQIMHCFTDVATKQGLPLPIINTISPETSKFLIGNNIDTYSMIRGIFLSMIINKIVEMIHRLYFDPRKDDKRLYEVKTRKVVLYSNTLSSFINVGYVASTNDLNRLDVGGLATTLWRIITDVRKINKIKHDFIRQSLDNAFRKEEDDVRQRLAKLGFEF